MKLNYLGGGGSVGEEKTFVNDYPLSPSGLWIPEKYLPMTERNVRFVQVRARTRGTGMSGAVAGHYVPEFFVTPPFRVYPTKAPEVLRPLVIENFGGI